MTNLNHHNGILPIKLGKAKILHTYKNLVHIVKLDDYITSINLIYKTLDSLVDFKDMHSMKNILKLKTLELENKINSLLPRHRNKRGIINGLGSIIKIISGNMDADDAQKINTELVTLNSNQKEINQNFNKQIILNNDMIRRFENIREHVNSQQTKIENYLKIVKTEIENNSHNIDTIIKYTQNVNLINFNIDLLNDHLNNINEAFILSKLNIISKHILYPKELKMVYEILKNESIFVTSDEQLYEFLELQAFYSGNDMIFNIKIPIVSNKLYSLFHTIPIQIKKTYMIPAQDFIIMNQDEIYETNIRCRNIENTFYCKSSDLHMKEDLQTCIRKIIENQPSNCNLVEKTPPSSITHIEENYIICINIPETNFESTCGTQKSTIEGNTLIHFQNCTVTINDIKYDNTAITHQESLTIYPTLNKDINATKILEELSLDKLQLSNFQNMKEISLIKEHHIQRDYISIMVIVIFIITGSMIWAFRKFKKQKTSPQQNTTFEDPRTRTPSAPVIQNFTTVTAEEREASDIANSSHSKNFLWPKL